MLEAEDEEPAAGDRFRLEARGEKHQDRTNPTGEELGSLIMVEVGGDEAQRCKVQAAAGSEARREYKLKASRT